jgi:hypothetical protein
MIPETGETAKVILYKSVSFPYSWEEYKVLESTKKLYDVTPFLHQNNWYCFASERTSKTTNPNDLLQLYILENGPLESWNLHPASPIKIDVAGGRSAGKIFQKNGKTYRPAQLGAPKYGYAVQIYEIVHLDTLDYVEVLVDTIYPNWNEKNLAIHTYNQVEGWQFIDCQRITSKL